MPWTARRARYQPASQVVSHDIDRLTRHYVLTRHGAVARIFLPGSLMVEIVLWRPSNRHPQFQGTVTSQIGDRFEYVATDPHGKIIATATNYIDAEAVLMPLRNRIRARTVHDWPDEIRASRVKPPAPLCDDCGWPLNGLPSARHAECGAG